MFTIVRSCVIIVLAIIGLAGCSGTSSSPFGSSADTAMAGGGARLFKANCASCHEFRQDGIGPALGGVTREATNDWLKKFIVNPQAMIKSGDQRADSLFRHFKTVMPPFALASSQLDSILAFLDTKQRSPEDNKPRQGILDPYPEKIKLSGLSAAITGWIQFPATSDSAKMPKTRITKMSFEPGSGDLFVNDLRGQLYKIVNGRPKVYLDMRRAMPHFISEPGLATGFGSFAFHPEFATNGLLYTTHTEAPRSAPADFSYSDTIKVEVQSVLTEWKVNSHAADTITGTHRELMRINMVAGAHGVQDVTFNPNTKKGTRDYGQLYIGVGDGASVQEGLPFVTHGKNKIWGSIIRIDPRGTNSRNGRYGIPGDNPFAQEKDSAIVKEIYAYGFRNPHRITWTTANDMLACNVGQSNIESINLIRPGADYGWPQREGHFVMNPYGDLNAIFAVPANDSVNHFTYPIAQFDHDEGNAICGGFEYTGSRIPRLRGKFLFGDIPSGRLFYINTGDVRNTPPIEIHEWKIVVNGKPTSLRELCGSDRVDLHFGRDKMGEMYMMTKADGKLYKIESAKVEAPAK